MIIASRSRALATTRCMCSVSSHRRARRTSNSSMSSTRYSAIPGTHQNRLPAHRGPHAQSQLRPPDIGPSTRRKISCEPFSFHCCYSQPPTTRAACCTATYSTAAPKSNSASSIGHSLRRFNRLTGRAKGRGSINKSRCLPNLTAAGLSSLTAAPSPSTAPVPQQPRPHTPR